ncbi:ammonium transporter, partial [Halanaerobium salsuginis]
MSSREMRSRFFKTCLTAIIMVILFSGFALAQDDLAAANSVAIDTIWTLIAAFLVFFMQAGFAMVEAGFTRAKNAGNIIMKNMMDFASGSLVYWICGFAFMFGAGNGFIGQTGFFLHDTFANLGLDIPVAAFFIFQTVFAATAATIVSGAMAERTNFSGYLAYSVVISAFIYPVVGHWIWGGGWLANMGMVDFAGSTVVHSVGGWAALAGAIV